MTTLTLNHEQSNLLREVLETTLSNLSYEIADTDSHDYKEQLKGRRSLLKEIHDAL